MSGYRVQGNVISNSWAGIKLGGGRRTIVRQAVFVFSLPPSLAAPPPAPPPCYSLLILVPPPASSPYIVDRYLWAGSERLSGPTAWDADHKQHIRSHAQCHRGLNAGRHEKNIIPRLDHLEMLCICIHARRSVLQVPCPLWRRVSSFSTTSLCQFVPP